jgi:trimeric autotransporter adhesin
MSTKTLRKRIALVAVAALGAGVLSVAPANAAPNDAPGTAGGEAAAGVLNIGTTSPTAGKAVIAATSLAASVGLVAVGDLAGTRVAGTTQTAVLLSTGTLSVYTGAPGSSTIAAITVDGGTISENTAGVTPAGNTSVAAAANTALGAAIRPNSGVSSMTVRLYTGATSGAFATATAAATSPSLGTLVGLITVTIASASESGTMVPSKSKLYYSDATVDSTDDGQSADADASTLNLGGLGCVNVQLNDGYSQDITSTTGILTATATNNAVLAFAAADCAAGTVTGSAFLTGTSPADVVLSVAAPSSAPLSTTVTISWNGVVVGTKSFVIRGKVSKVTISGGTLGKAAGGANAAAGSVKFEDAAGNTVYPTSSSTSYPLNSNTFSLSTSADGALIASAAIDGTIVPNASTGVTGAYQFTCNAGAYGTEKFSMMYINTDGSIVTSNTVNNSCTGTPVSYTAKWDKAKYAPGELMKLQITVKDSKGNLSNDYSAIGTSVANTDPVFDGAPNAGVNIGTLKDGLDTPVTGVLEYRFIAGTTEGTFASLISLPNLNSTLTGQVAQTASYTIAAATAGVTNADVLKAIVSLIASINKQIAALQKALLRR